MFTFQKMLQTTLMTVALSACTSNESSFNGSNLIRVIPNGRAVFVVNTRTESEARPWAVEYCNKQGLSPQFKGMGMRGRSTSAAYDCLAANDQ